MRTAEETDTPLCTRCLRPVRPHDHYCEKCGEAVGRYTTYLPFVDIKFQADFVGEWWRWAWARDTGIFKRVGSILLFVVLAPFLLIGLPFIRWTRRRGHRARGSNRS